MNSIEELERELNLLRSRNNFLEQQMKQKDKQLSDLNMAHSTLRDMKRSASVHSFHPTMVLDALPQEFEAVKKGLLETAEKCQQLLFHLDLVSQTKAPEEKKNRDFQTQTSSPEELEQRATVLRASINVLNRRLDTWKESHIFHTQAVQHETFQDAIAQFHEAQNEADRLRTDNLRLSKETQELRRFIENITAVHDLEGTEAKEKIQVLKQQTLTYSEDFENERRDREAAQSLVADLEKEVSSLKKLVQSYETKQMDEICRRREEALERYRREYYLSHPTTGLYQTDSTTAEEVGEDTVDAGISVKQLAIDKH